MPNKVIFLGDAGVGKTKVIQRYISGKFDKGGIPTVMMDNSSITISINRQSIPLEIWDTAGQEAFRSIVPVYIRNASLAVIMFDVSNPSTLTNADIWYDLILEHAGTNCSIILVGNKLDLFKDQINLEDVEVWVTEHSTKLVYTSALSGEGIHELFNEIATTILESTMKEAQSYNINILDHRTQEKSGCSC